MPSLHYSDPNKEIPEILNGDYDLFGALQIYLWTQKQYEFSAADVNFVVNTVICSDINSNEPISDIISLIFENGKISREATDLIIKVWESAGLITKGRNHHWVIDEEVNERGLGKT